MIYKITVIKTRGFNYDKAEIGMNVEISSSKLSPFFGQKLTPFNIPNNNDLIEINNAFKTKYNVDLKNEGVLSSYPDAYLKCEKL